MKDERIKEKQQNWEAILYDLRWHLRKIKLSLEELKFTVYIIIPFINEVFFFHSVFHLLEKNKLSNFHKDTRILIFE